MEIYLEDECIDTDISSTASPHHKESEFEFQTPLDPVKKETTSYPADELFYNGTLFPLHLSPRIHVIQKLLEENVIDSITISQKYPLHESCKMSTVDSCHVDGGYTNDVKMTSWCKTLKLLQQKPKPYLNPMFTTKSKCTDPNVRNTMKSTKTFNEKATYRKPFSGAIHHEMKKKSLPMSLHSSSLPSSSSSNVYSPHFSSVGTEIESLIQDVIAHCKETQVRVLTR